MNDKKKEFRISEPVRTEFYKSVSVTILLPLILLASSIAGETLLRNPEILLRGLGIFVYVVGTCLFIWLLDLSIDKT